MINRTDINILLADSYYEFAKTDGMDMRKVTEILETFRPHFSAQPDYDIWKRIPLGANDLDNESLLHNLSKLKSDYYNLVFKASVQHIHQITATDPESGFQAWLQIYAEAIINWESQVYDRLDDIEFNFSDEHRKYLKDAQKFHDNIRDNRWFECYERYQFLADNEYLFPLQRAILYCILAQIQIYYRADMECAMSHLETAQKLVPQANAKIERCFGEWYLKNRDFDKARIFFMSAMSLDINDADSYLAMGDSYKDEHNMKVAEEYYIKAIGKNPLDASPYDRLIYIYGEPDMIVEKEPELEKMLHKIELLNFNASDKRYSNWRYNGYKAMGYVYYNNKNFPKAIEWYTKAIKLHPEWSSAYIDLGNTYSAADDKTAAKKLLIKAQQVAPDNYDACFSLAVFYELEGSFEEAISFYTKCIELRPTNAKDLYLDIESIYINDLNAPEKALESLNKLKDIYPENPDTYVKIAEIQKKSDNLAAAEEAYRKAVEINPNDANNWNEIGVLLYQKQDYREAAKHFEKALTFNASDPIFYGNLADAYLNSGETEKSEETLRQAILQFPKNADLLNRLGNYHYDIKQYDKAQEYYLKAIEIQPENAVFTSNLAGAFKMREDLANAITYYEKALQLAPGNDYYLNELGIIAFRQNQFEKSAGYFSQATISAPSNATYFDNLGQSLIQVPGKEEETENAFLKAVSLSPDNDLYLNRLGNFYIMHGMYQASLDTYLKTVALQPGNPIYLANAGYAKFLLHQYEEAIQLLEKAIALEPELSQIHIWLAQVFDAQGNSRKGADYLLDKMAKKDDPSYLTPFLEIYAKILDQEEVKQKALEIIDRQPLIFQRYEELVDMERQRHQPEA